MTLVSVPCAVCEGTDFSPVHPGTLQDIDDEVIGHFSSSRVKAHYLPIVRCRRCGLVQSNPRDDTETLARVYGELADHAYEREGSSRQLGAKAHLSLVLSHRRPPGRLLDVGCATGIFVERAFATGFDATGTDPSRWAVERARERVRGARFVSGMLETVVFDPHSFVVVTLWDVLEHVDSPKNVLGRVRQWLKPGGLCCLSTPNVESLVARVMGPRWVLLLREHLWYFSPATIARLLSQSGFVVLETKSKWVSSSFSHIARRLSQYGGQIARAATQLSQSRLLQSASVRFPIGEMNVVARLSR
jgi:2-polyprenyl-3-methyl-5-hydroxy-6-metoxy-1,4-benzoquinol methylase